MPIRCTLRVLIARKNAERIEAGGEPLTQAEVARESGLEEAQISRLATGKQRRIDFATLDALCRYFVCTPGELLVYSPDDRPAEGKP